MGLGAAATLALSSSASASPEVAPHAPTAIHVGGVVEQRVASQATCFANLTGDTGVAVNSQNYEAAFDAYDSQAADDFILAGPCTVTSIDIIGAYYSGAGPAVSETVTFYADADGKPGAVLNTQTVAGADVAGSFAIHLSPVTFAPGTTYWVSVQINMDFTLGGQWGWENTSTLMGLDAQWQNPGGGLGTCTTWGDMQTCVGAPGPDFMFSLNGSATPPFEQYLNPSSKYKRKSCALNVSGVSDGTIVNKFTDPTCLHRGKAYKVEFTPGVQKFSVPASWPGWGVPAQTESATPNVLYTRGAMTLTVTYKFSVRVGGLEVQPLETDGRTVVARFYSGENGTGTVVGSVTRVIGGNARLLAGQCSGCTWKSIVVSADVPFAIAMVRG